MHLNFTFQQEMVREAARNFMRDKYLEGGAQHGEGDATGRSSELWRQMAELGWPGLAIPEEFGGAGMGFLELATMLEEMGRVRPISPFFSTVVLGGLALLEAGSEGQKRAFLPEIAAGGAIWTLALTENRASLDAGGITMEATAQGDGYVLNGTKLFVRDAQVADYMLCVARTGEGDDPQSGITVFIVETKTPGVSCTPYRTLDDDTVCEVAFDGVRVPAARILGRQGEGWGLVQQMMDKAAVAKCCEMVGGARRVLEMTIEYAKERKQFNRPIGSFQAIQHHCSNMVSDVDSSWLVTYEAAWRIGAGLPYALEASMAKAWVSEAYKRVVALGHQVHGGIGLMEEHDLPRYFKLASVAEVDFGDSRYHRNRVAQRLGH